jgi:hypothetical protein
MALFLGEDPIGYSGNTFRNLILVQSGNAEESVLKIGFSGIEPDSGHRVDREAAGPHARPYTDRGLTIGCAARTAQGRPEW